MALLELANVSFSYTSSVVVENLNLAIDDAQIICIMGPSGCGKSSVLRLLSGLEKPQSGHCFFEGAPLKYPSGRIRYSFQDFDAFPWRTVRENLLLGGASEHPCMNALPIRDLIDSIGLRGHEHKYPAELSGGMRKRLALGRSLAGRPKVILLDEPFSSLDMDARQEMYTLLQELWCQWRCVFVVVTHDIHEALTLARRIVVSEHLPFRVKADLAIPFCYPRDDSIMDTTEYASLANCFRRLF